jgi:lactate dehydrogenase-like 2-hydroxyacid dehydrogenase
MVNFVVMFLQVPSLLGIYVNNVPDYGVEEVADTALYYRH